MNKLFYILFVLYITTIHGYAQTPTSLVQPSNSSTKIKLDKVAFMTNRGKSVKINAQLINAVGKIKWSSDNKSVATVNGSGRVKAKSAGDAIITAMCDTLMATCRVSVDFEGQNPPLPPSWGLYICDPEPYVIDGRMYIYGSRDCPMSIESDGSLGYCSKDYHVIYSDDLINWTDAGVTLRLDDIPANMRNGGDRLWGPSNIFKSPTEKDKYYFIANTNSYTSGMVLFESPTPTGPFTNPKLITMNGVPLDNLDPGVLVDDDGKVYFSYQYPANEYNFAICQLDPNDYSQVLPETVRDVTNVFRDATDEWPDEGVSLKKHGNLYYYICMLTHQPNNINRIPVKMAYLIAEDPLGPWRYGGKIIDTYNYLNSSNIQGAFAEFKGKWYVSYHVPTSDGTMSRYNWLDPITFNSDGTIRQIEMTSSGAKGNFEILDKIQSSSGVHFSGGRGDNRIKQRYTGDLSKWWLPNFEFIDYPETWYNNASDFIGYRYMKFNTSINQFQIRVKSNSHGGILKLYLGAQKGSIDDGPHDGPTGEAVAILDVPNTNGTYQTFTIPAKIVKDGIYSFYLKLDTAPTDGAVYVDWMRFK